MSRSVLSSETYHRLHIGAGLIFLCSVILVVFVVLFKLAPAIALSMDTLPGPIPSQAALDMTFILAALTSIISYVSMTVAMRMSNMKRREENVQALLQGKCA